VRVLLRLAAVLTLAVAAATVVGQLLARRRTWGDDDADDVSMATCFGGIDRSLNGEAVRHVSAAAWLGGINLDLREAKLAPEGADVELEALMGGIKLTVPAEWRVEVEKDVSAGGIDAHVTPSEELPSGAPLLSVVARARMGGVLVTNGRDEAEREGAPEPASASASA
jgi:Cell wall-active antibiotics response 4TMS YvqF